MKDVRLFTPGPTPLPQRVRDISSWPMIHHRSEKFTNVLQSARHRLSEFCDSDGETVLLSATGTAGMEACVASLFAPGDEVVVVEGGKFGERWVELANQYDLNATVLSVEWGKTVRFEDVAKKITPQTKGVLLQACETSTGVYHPVEKIGQHLRSQSNCVLIVDGITALGIHDLSLQRDGVDVLIGGSQKGLMCPPGVATVTLQPRALKRLGQTKQRSYYLSLGREVAAQKKGQTAFTPAISLIRALNVALGLMEQEGRKAIFKRHDGMQKMARSALREIGLTLLTTDEDAAYGVTAAEAPKGVDLKAWLTNLKKEQGLWLAGGQGKLAGKIFRLAHMGACTPDDLISAIETIEESLAAHYPGAKNQVGSAQAKKLKTELELS